MAGEEAKPMKFDCSYCSKGSVPSLPATCPNCGADLIGLVKDMTPKQLEERWIRNMMRLNNVEYFLAS